MEKILILGNGFNAALGINVGYEDFLKSSFWEKISKVPAPLINFIDQNVKVNNYNIEEILANYVQHHAKSQNAKKDAKGLETLEDAFSGFVEDVFKEKISLLSKDGNEYNKISKSKAFKVLSTFQKWRNIDPSTNVIWIYSFCYVLYEKLCKLGENGLYEDIKALSSGQENPLGAFMSIDYLHGRSSQGKSKAIFGLSEKSFEGVKADIIASYQFLLKEKHPNYAVENKAYLMSSLIKADLIEFYGFSFSLPDRPYVREWLTTIPSFKGKRTIRLNILSKDKPTIISAMESIAGANWGLFISHYDIVLSYEDGREEIYITDVQQYKNVEKVKICKNINFNR